MVLRALSEQSDASFDIVVADDGSGPETLGLVERWRRRSESGSRTSGTRTRASGKRALVISAPLRA